MKKFFHTIALSSLFTAVILSGVKISHAQISSITLLSDDGNTSSIRFDFGSINQEQVSTPHGDAMVITIDKGTPMLQAGAPDLPKLATSLIIPDNKDMELTVTSSHYTDYTDISVAPSKGTLVRTVDPSSIAYTYNTEIYGQDFFYPKDIAELRSPYILRDYRGQTVLAYPVQYNAATKTLRVYSDITVKVSPKNSGTGENVFIRNKSFDKVQTEFSNIYQNQFLNYSSSTTRYEPLNDHGNMLIICGSDFLEAIQPFADWKNQEGIKTEVVDVATVGNDATSIKNYVIDYYNNNGLTFLLLVGDNAQVSTGVVAGAGDSDNQYGYITGSDHYQEIFVGRFSATTTDEVTTQVTRTIEYEKDPMVDGYYAKGVGIASDQGAGQGDDGEADYDHERNIRNELLGYTYTDIQELFDGNHPGGNDASGYPSDADLANLVNAGTGLINYTGHGDITLIVTTGFNNSDVDALTNTHQWPFVWIVGCQTGNFKNNTCFAEKWARHSYNGDPSGSLANFMSTINQYWAEPMEMQDEGTNIMAEVEADNIKRTFGGISINGCFSMNDAYGNSGFDMTDTWVLFGDPSVMIRTAEPTTMTVSHNQEILLGANQFTVNCDFDGAVVAITNNNEILGTGDVFGGIATVDFANELANADSVLITITGFNKIPYITKIPAIAASGPYIVTSSLILNDASGNNNGLSDYDENIGLDVTMENVGSATAYEVVSTLETTDPFITITDNSESYGDIASSVSSTHTNAFAFTVADNVPDGHVALFSGTMTDNINETWTTGFPVTLNAPVLGVTSFVIDDSNGNNDGHLDPGETVTLSVYNTNSGHADALNATGVLISSDPFITISNPNYSLGNLAVGSTPAASFDVIVDASAPYGTDVLFTYTVSAGNYSGSSDFSAVVTPAIEDFETGDFTQYDWELSGNQNWQTETYDVYEGQYSARSGSIGNSQSSTLLVSLDALFDDEISFMMKVSSEGNYDSLSFRIDNISQGHWSGEIGWSAKTYPVTEGLHTFAWKYQKDNGVSMGFDCAYLDNIVLPTFEINQGTGEYAPELSNEISCYPNPFSRLTFIDYSVSNPADVTVEVFDVSGKLVKTILNNDHQTPGNYHLGFDGSALAGGSYFCNISMNGKTATQKLILSR